MENNFYVYRHVRLDNNNTFYIGKGKGPRAKSKSGRSLYWNNITKKCNYRIDIIKDNLTELEAYDLERNMICLFKKCGKLINKTNGGPGHKGLTLSEETKQKIRNKRKFQKNTRKGIPHSEEVKIKLSLLNQKQFSTRESRDRHSILMGGKPFIVYKKDSTEIVGEYISKSSCSRELNVALANLCKCLHGQRKHTKGYSFKYKTAA